MLRFYLVLGSILLACGSCGAESGTSSPLTTQVDAAPPDAACLAGSSPDQCARCPAPSPSCVRACPAVSCNVWPLPAECEGVCSDDLCCECFNGTWVSANPPVCGTECTGMKQDWQQIVADVGACEHDEDCIAVGGPQTCGADEPSIGGGGVAVNRALYESSNGPVLEEAYRDSCPGGAVHVKPPDVGCIHGKCGISKLHACD